MGSSAINSTVLKAEARKQLPNESAKQGKKVVFDPTKMGASAKYSGVLGDDFNKVTVVVPPGSKIIATFTMIDNTQKKISFENTGTTNDIKGRIYFDSRTGEFSVAEDPERTEAEIEAKKDGVGYQSCKLARNEGSTEHFFETKRTLKKLDSGAKETVVVGSLEQGTRRATLNALSFDSSPVPVGAKLERVAVKTSDESLDSLQEQYDALELRRESLDLDHIALRRKISNLRIENRSGSGVEDYIPRLAQFNQESELLASQIAKVDVELTHIAFKQEKIYQAERPS